MSTPDPRPDLPPQGAPLDPVPSTAAARLRDLLQLAEPLVVSDAEQAEAALREAQKLAGALGDTRSEALALTLLGATFFFRSQYPTALQVLGQAQAAADRAQDDRITARVLNNLGNCEVALGNYGEGMEYYQQSLRLAQACGDEDGRTRALSNVGLIHLELGEHELALEVFQEVLALAEEAQDALSQSSSTINLVLSYYHVGRYADALTLGAAHLPVVRALGVRQHEVVLRAWLLPCLIQTGQAGDAARQAEDLLPLAQAVDDREYVAYIRAFYGQALTQLGQLDAAQEQLLLALAEAQQHGARLSERTVLQHLSELHAARGEWQQAYERLQAYEALNRTLHAEAVARKAQVMGAQMQVEILRREADAERRRSAELTQANTALQAAQEALSYRATHDALTGLANRAHFQAELERAVQAASPAPFGVLFIDLDRFKQVNDTLGHEVGDELLKAVAGQLRGAVRSGDLVARMGGDEFTILLRSLREPRDAERVAHKILNALAQPLLVCGHTLQVTGSIGVAVAPRDGQDVGTLQKHADLAMYRAKQGGKNGVRTFQPGPDEASPQPPGHLEVERDLRGALVRGEFVLHYQGQYDVRTQALTGFEALLRWQHPTQGLLPPGEFLGIAEDSQLILPVGAWVLREACGQAAAWQTRAPGLTISVNVSALQFEQPGFLTTVQQALEASGLAPQHLILELTEQAAARHPEAAAQQLSRLRGLGVQIALDDFGTGQSSLSLLHQLPIDLLKIDRSFLQAAPDPEANRVFIGVMITLAHGLNLLVTAEGVETSQQRALLGELGCDSMQGFLLTRPLPAAEAEGLLTLPAISAPPASPN
ncbi:EAL domain-containing protein [Deinococcus sp. HMF7604]|uniref:EAL domain-containing protein n=1 Tax=Deinococcus betulae TaxID=2873312 RepID=UPI001CC97E6C|nr:EAL domain-containing protein [Deinococcus betulae]